MAWVPKGAEGAFRPAVVAFQQPEIAYGAGPANQQG
jgi:hypothetical protein